MIVEGRPLALKIVLEHALFPVGLHVGILAQQHDQVVFNAEVGKVKLHAVQKLDALRAKIKPRFTAVADCDLKILKACNIQRFERHNRPTHRTGRLPQHKGRNTAHRRAVLVCLPSMAAKTQTARVPTGLAQPLPLGLERTSAGTARRAGRRGGEATT